MTAAASPAIAPGVDAAPAHAKPQLVFFHSSQSGRCRRVEGFLAQVLQHRRNHGTFRLYRVPREARPDLLERFGVDELPTLVVVDGGRVRARLARPTGCRDIERFLAPWLK
jgi:thioredoxin-like negative regulator of GroEL